MNKSEIVKYIGNLVQVKVYRHYTLNKGRGNGMSSTNVFNIRRADVL